MVLFPQILAYAVPEPFYAGFLMHSEQAISVKAAIEAHKQISRLQASGALEGPGTRRRRASTIVSSRPGSLRVGATSPASVKANLG
jgi:hypothetical protein